MPAEVEAFFAAGAAGGRATVDADHGRVKARRHAVARGRPAALRSPPPGRAPPPGAGDARHGRGRRRPRRPHRRHHHLSSARPSAAAFARAARAHWRLENALRRALDAGFDEDRARNREDNGPENLALLRRLALGLLRAARPDISVRRERKRSG